MFRPVFRFLGLCLLATAFVTVVVDVTRSVTGGKEHVTPLGEALTALAPGKVASARGFIERHVHPFVWDPILVDLMRLPVWLAFGGIGCLAIRLGRKPPPKFGFSSR
jgi:hypothetical protein